MTKTKKISKTKNLVLTDAELQELAHSSTKEAITKIEKYMKSEKDPEKKAMAEMYLEECEFFYYQASNEKEEQAFMLCVLINIHEKKISKIEMEIARVTQRIEKFELEKAVHEKVLAKHKNKINDWQYRYMDDFVICDHNQLKDLRDDLSYEKAWIEAAKKMITIAKYKNGIPERHLSHFDFGFEDDGCGDNCGCGCCNDEHACCGNESLDWRNDEIIREDLLDDYPF